MMAADESKDDVFVMSGFRPSKNQIPEILNRQFCRGFALALIVFGVIFAPPMALAETQNFNGTHAHFDLGLNEGVGTFGSQNGVIPTCSVDSTAGFLELGLNFDSVAPILYGEYSIGSQTTPVNQVANTNVSGSGYLAGGGVRFDWPKVMISALYFPVGAYTFSQPTSTGQTSSFVHPSGFQVDLGFRPMSDVVVTVNYRSVQYTSQTVNGSATGLTGNVLVNAQFGVSLRWGN